MKDGAKNSGKLILSQHLFKASIKSMFCCEKILYWPFLSRTLPLRSLLHVHVKHMVRMGGFIPKPGPGVASYLGPDLLSFVVDGYALQCKPVKACTWLTIVHFCTWASLKYLNITCLMWSVHRRPKFGENICVKQKQLCRLYRLGLNNIERT